MEICRHLKTSKDNHNTDGMMTTKRFNGKAIYQPSGKAAEYSPWACNFYTGCSNDCEYCYCKRGVMSHVWSNEPRLKKCFKDKTEAIACFEKELRANIDELRKHGILFSFTTDPMLPETLELTLTATGLAGISGVPVKILTKRADWLDTLMWAILNPILYRDKVAFGFTLTGFDEKEPGASTNQERVEAMRELHDMGFKTFASIEPIITPAMSRNMMEATKDFCDLYKVGLISGKGKDFYRRDHMEKFYGWLVNFAFVHKVYLKDSFLKYIGIEREDLRGKFVNVQYYNRE